MVCYFLLQRIFLTQGSNLCLLSLLLLLLLSCCFSCVRLCMTPPGSPIPGILQARTLEWVAISFSNAWKWKLKVKSLSHVQLLATPWTTAHQAPPSMGFSRSEYWGGVPLPSPWVSCIDRQMLYHCATWEAICVFREHLFSSAAPYPNLSHSQERLGAPELCLCRSEVLPKPDIHS